MKLCFDNVEQAAYMRWLYPQPDEARDATDMYKDAPRKELPDMTFEEYEAMETDISVMPVMQSGNASQLWYQSIAAYGPTKNLPPPPLAPDGYIPNSIIWQKMRLYGGEPGVGAMPAGWKPQAMSDEQMNAQLLDPDSDEEAGGDLMLAALASDAETEDEVVSDEEVEQPKRTKRRAQARRPSDLETPKVVPNKFKKRTKEEPPPTPPSSPEPELEAPPTPPPPPLVKEKPPSPPPPAVVVEIRPPLPRYITMFRGEPWFEALFPRAIAKTFDFLRPHGPVENAWPQVTLSDWLEHLASSDLEAGGGLGFTGQRKGLIWKSQQGTLDKKHFDGMLHAINKLASDDSVRPLFGTEDIQLISTTILEVLRAGRRAAELEKAEDDKKHRKRRRKKKPTDLEVHVEGDEDADFPAGESSASEAGTDDDVVGELGDLDPADINKLRQNSMACVDTLTKLKVTSKVSIQEILLLKTMGDESEKLMAHRSLMALGLQDPQNVLMHGLLSGALAGELSNLGSDERIRRKTSLTHLGHFLGQASTEFAAKRWKERALGPSGVLNIVHCVYYL